MFSIREMKQKLKEWARENVLIFQNCLPHLTYCFFLNVDPREIMSTKIKCFCVFEHIKCNFIALKKSFEK